MEFNSSEEMNRHYNLMNSKLYGDIDKILNDVNSQNSTITELYQTLKEEKDRKGKLVDHYDIEINEQNNRIN